MPVLFLGHGSPMNAIEENTFTKGFRDVSARIPRPEAILCISAHWETNGTFVTAMDTPRTIHDFGGFPQELYEVQYPAPGNPGLAERVAGIITRTEVGPDLLWGLDHGAWSVLRHMYPEADVPVVQLSLDRSKPASYHYELAKEIGPLRDRGVLVVGSGNMVHNLGMIAWNRLKEDNYGYDWAREASSRMKGFIQDGNHQALIRYDLQGEAFRLAIPTPEHYLPLIYAVALGKKKEPIAIFNDKAVGGSLTMTSVMIGGSE